MSASERDPVYPSFVHLGDRVAKPVSVMRSREPEAMAELLAESIDLLLLFLDQPIAPGRAYHPPTHAAMVLGPLLDRFGDDPVHGALVHDRLGKRDDFIEHLIAMLPGAQADPAGMDEVEYIWRRYVGTFLANVLVRLDARAALPELRATLDLWQARGATEPAIAGTTRALAGLGELGAREELLASDEPKPLLWLARYGTGEGQQWARRSLRPLLPGAPEDPLRAMWQATLVERLTELGLTGH